MKLKKGEIGESEKNGIPQTKILIARRRKSSEIILNLIRELKCYSGMFI